MQYKKEFRLRGRTTFSILLLWVAFLPLQGSCSFRRAGIQASSSDKITSWIQFNFQCETRVYTERRLIQQISPGQYTTKAPLAFQNTTMPFPNCREIREITLDTSSDLKELEAIQVSIVHRVTGKVLVGFQKTTKDNSNGIHFSAILFDHELDQRIPLEDVALVVGLHPSTDLTPAEPTVFVTARVDTIEGAVSLRESSLGTIRANASMALKFPSTRLQESFNLSLLRVLEFTNTKQHTIDVTIPQTIPAKIVVNAHERTWEIKDFGCRTEFTDSPLQKDSIAELGVLLPEDPSLASPDSTISSKGEIVPAYSIKILPGSTARIGLYFQTKDPSDFFGITETLPSKVERLPTYCDYQCDVGFQLGFPRKPADSDKGELFDTCMSILKTMVWSQETRTGSHKLLNSCLEWDRQFPVGSSSRFCRQSQLNSTEDPWRVTPSFANFVVGQIVDSPILLPILSERLSLGVNSSTEYSTSRVPVDNSLEPIQYYSFPGLPKIHVAFDGTAQPMSYLPHSLLENWLQITQIVRDQEVDYLTGSADFWAQLERERQRVSK